MSVMESRGKRDMNVFSFQHLIYYGYTQPVKPVVAHTKQKDFTHCPFFTIKLV